MTRAGEDVIAQSLVGRTITRAKFFDTDPESDWTGHEVCWLWLDDGRTIEFGAWGHDAWGATLNEIEVMDVDRCLHCGQEHKDAVVTDGWEGSSAHLPKTTFAWCSDGNHAAWIKP